MGESKGRIAKITIDVMVDMYGICTTIELLQNTDVHTVHTLDHNLQRY